jgi:hypothetical protein
MFKIVNQWGIKDAELFASFQTMKPYNSSKSIHLSQTSKKDIYDLQQKSKERVRVHLINTIIDVIIRTFSKIPN